MKICQKALFISAAAVLLTGAPSVACNFPQIKMTSVQIKQHAKDSFARSNAIVDAEVVEPMRFGPDWKAGLTPIAYLRVLKTVKGQVRDDDLPLVYITSCDIGLTTKGERIRILLTGVGVFRAEQGMNGGGIDDLATYNAEIDRLAGHRRAPALAHFPGALLRPMSKRIVR